MSALLGNTGKRTAHDLARLIHVGHRRSRSATERDEYFRVFVHEVADELVALGEPRDSVMELVIAVDHALLDEMMARIEPQDKQPPPSPSE